MLHALEMDDDDELLSKKYIDLFVDGNDDSWLENYSKVCHLPLFDDNNADEILKLFNVEEGTYAKICQEKKDMFERNLEVYKQASRDDNTRHIRVTYPREGQHRKTGVVCCYTASAFTREDPKFVPNSLTMEYFTDISGMKEQQKYEDQQYAFSNKSTKGKDPIENIKNIFRGEGPEGLKEPLITPLRVKISSIKSKTEMQKTLGKKYSAQTVETLIMADSELCRSSKLKCSKKTVMESIYEIVEHFQKHKWRIAPLARPDLKKMGHYHPNCHKKEYATADEEKYHSLYKDSSSLLKSHEYSNYISLGTIISWTNAQKTLFKVPVKEFYEKSKTFDKRHRAEHQDKKSPSFSPPFTHTLSEFYLNKNVSKEGERSFETYVANHTFLLPALIRCQLDEENGSKLRSAMTYIIYHGLIRDKGFCPRLDQPEAAYYGLVDEDTNLYVGGNEVCLAMSSAILISECANAVLCIDPDVERLRKALGNVRASRFQLSDHEMKKTLGKLILDDASATFNTSSISQFSQNPVTQRYYTLVPTSMQ